MSPALLVPLGWTRNWRRRRGRQGKSVRETTAALRETRNDRVQQEERLKLLLQSRHRVTQSRAQPWHDYANDDCAEDAEIFDDGACGFGWFLVLDFEDVNHGSARCSVTVAPSAFMSHHMRVWCTRDHPLVPFQHGLRPKSRQK